MATVGDVIKRLLPWGPNPLMGGAGARSRGRRQKKDYRDFPRWPPDLFAVAATIIETSGCYSLPELGGWSRQSLYAWAKYQRYVRRVATDWRQFFAGGPQPKPVALLWGWLLDAWDEPLLREETTERAPTGEIPVGLTWREIAALLMAIADETCAHVGFPSRKQGNANPVAEIVAVEYRDYLADAGRDDRRFQIPRSLCRQVPIQETCVQPKSVTAQVGCTLRSMSHHLALLPSIGEAATRWHLWTSTETESLEARREGVPRDRDHARPFNLLIVPFPFRIDGRAFRAGGVCIDDMAGVAPRHRAGFFVVEQTWLKKGGLDVTSMEASQYLADLVREAARDASAVHGIVLPELALAGNQIEEIAELLGDNTEIEVFVSGIGSSRTLGERSLPLNSVFTAVFLRPENGPAQFQHWEQPKHHRWKLDAGQIRSYQLGDRLDPARAWWEAIDLSVRECNVFAFRPRASMATLVCEDLARIDPMQRALRAIGPNLVIALLMDGPQHEWRWGGRYATVLGDDPGSAVITLSSLGMIRRYHLPEEKFPVSIGLWKEPYGRARELLLPEGADALLLSLTLGSTTGSALDSRSDHGATVTLSLGGVHPIMHPARPAWVQR